MKYAIIFGSNIFIGASGILNVNVDNKNKEFFRVREFYRERSEGSFLAVDCDIKDKEGKREIKLFKNKPVAGDESVNVTSSKNSVEVVRNDGTLILKIEQLEIGDPSLQITEEHQAILKEQAINTILKFSGSFQAGPYLIESYDDRIKIGTNTISGNILVGTGGLTLKPQGFEF